MSGLKQIKVGNKAIGENCPVFIIAEAGANFRISDDPKTNFSHALRLIDLAAEAKADAVKFQLYRAEKLYSKKAGSADYLGKNKPIYDIIKEMELPYEWLPKLKKHCDDKGIIFLCSPFDEESSKELEKVSVPAYKIASYELNHIPLIKHIAGTGKPIIFSTGASNKSDIDLTIRTINGEGNHLFVIMQCTAKYPAPLDSINLNVIPWLKKKYGCPVGLSDHSREPLIASLGAVALGAKVIEKHFTTDNSLPGPDHSFAILPHELKELVTSIRKMEQCLGTPEKNVGEQEKELYNFAKSSIYSVGDIQKGEALTSKNLAVLRSGKHTKGLEPKYFEFLVGKKAKRHIPEGSPISRGDYVG